METGGALAFLVVTSLNHHGVYYTAWGLLDLTAVDFLSLQAWKARHDHLQESLDKTNKFQAELVDILSWLQGM